MKISSSSFGDNKEIPSKYTCDGENVNPALSFSDIPQNAKSLVLIVDDPDAPRGTWVHWILWNISPMTTEIKENSVPSEARQGKTSSGDSEYEGPCPPSGTHHYHFKLFALDTTLDISPDADAEMLETAIEGHIIDSAELVGLYSREK